MDNIHFITVADTYPCYNYKYKLAAVSTKYKLVQVGPSWLKVCFRLLLGKKNLFLRHGFWGQARISMIE